MLEAKHAARRAMALQVSAVATRGAAAAITIRPLPPQARLSLRLRPDDARAVGSVAGLTLDIPINSWVTAGERSISRLGPNEWLILDAEADTDALAPEIEAALAGTFHALVDIGHRNVAIAVSGPYAAEVINSGCALDLSPDAFPTGAATRTLLAKAEILLMRLDDQPTYRVECWRSFAAYVDAFLREAARPFEAPAG